MVGVIIGGILLTAHVQAVDTVVVRAITPATGSADLELVEEVRLGSIEGPPETSFGNVVSVAVTADGTTYVADVQVPVIRIFGAEGEYVGDLGRDGEGPGEYEGLWALAALPGGEIAVWHDFAQVTVFGPDGAFRTRFTAPLNGLVGGPGPSLVADTAGHLMMRVTAGAFQPGVTRVIRYAWLHVDSEGALIDSLIAPDRDLEHSPAAFRTETASTPSPHEYLVIGRNDDYALHRPLADGRVLRIERVHEPIPIEAQEREQWEAYSAVFEERQGMDFPPLAPSKPAFRELQVDADGRIWVHRYAPAEHHPAFVDASTDFGWPNRNWLEPVRHDVLDPRGAFLGTVTLPHRAQILFARGPHLWTRELGGLDEHYVVRYRIPALQGGR
jgi:hypothetical protein